MTDDELERALLALPLDEPPPGLHERILAATIAQPPLRSTAGAWTDIALGSAGLVLAIAALAVFLAAIPGAGMHIKLALVSAFTALGLFHVGTYVWLAVGLSSVWAISSLPLMPPTPRPAYNG